MSIFINDTATTEIYTLSLHDALPISHLPDRHESRRKGPAVSRPCTLTTSPHRSGLARSNWRNRRLPRSDRKSTRLNSSHPSISYAVFCLKKKNTFQLRSYSSHSLSRP